MRRARVRCALLRAGRPVNNSIYLHYLKCRTVFETCAGAGEGLITYMRTDGVQVSEEALAAMRDAVAAAFGPEYVPASPRVYKCARRLAASVFRTAIAQDNVSTEAAQLLGPRQRRVLCLMLAHRPLTVKGAVRRGCPSSLRCRLPFMFCVCICVCTSWNAGLLPVLHACAAVS